MSWWMFRHWLAGNLYRLALWVHPESASKQDLREALDGRFWIDPSGRFAKRRST